MHVCTLLDKILGDLGALGITRIKVVFKQYLAEKQQMGK